MKNKDQNLNGIKTIKFKETFSLVVSCLKLLNVKERNKFIIVSVFLFISSCLEMIALAAIMPFITLIIEPEVIMKKDFFLHILNLFGNQAVNDLIIIFAIISIFLLIFSLSISYSIQHNVRKFVAVSQIRLANEIINECLRAPFTWFSENNSTRKSHFLQTDILMWGNDGILRIMQMIGCIFLLIAALGTLIYVAPLGGVIGMFLIIIVSLIILNTTRKKISYLSDVRRRSHTTSLSNFRQIIEAIKDIRISNKESFFSNEFLSNFSEYVKSGVYLRFFQNISPIIIIALGQICIVAVAMILWVKNYTGGEIASIMALIILILSRIVPNVNKLISDIGGIWAAYPHVKSLQSHKKFFKNIDNLKINQKSKKAYIWHKLEMLNIEYQYPNSTKKTLKNINLSIEQGKSYGLVGKSGSGKTTLINLLTGLIETTKGSIKVDNSNLKEINNANWLKQIGYIPQMPFILDDTIRENIAFGMDEDQIDERLVLKCLKIAQLENFIKKLPHGLDTIIGERGSKISGGQIQRIAIARALYDKPNLLILDEATSSIDKISERSFIKSINKMKGVLTTITIAHNMSTVINCDKIFVLDEGKIISNGNYRSLQKSCKVFQELSQMD